MSPILTIMKIKMVILEMRLERCDHVIYRERLS